MEKNKNCREVFLRLHNGCYNVPTKKISKTKGLEGDFFQVNVYKVKYFL